MARYIHRQRHRQTKQLTDCFERSVDTVSPIEILSSFIDIAVAVDDGEQVDRVAGGVAVDYFLHTFLPLHRKRLPGLSTAISKNSALQIALAHIRHIDELNPAQIKRQ